VEANRGPQSVRNLEIWRVGLELVRVAYEVTRGWPREELYGLTSQVRRAAVSVPTNIAEGVGRNTRAETSRFATIALGSLYELDTLLEVANGQGYPVANLQVITAQLIRQTSAFAQHQRLVATRMDPQATSHKPQARRG
jgi:four helix bundle protein